MTINEYQGNPVSAVPAGFIRYDDYIAGGGKDPNEEITGTTTGTGVETTQVGGGTSDDERREETKLFDTLKTYTERNRIEKFNTLLYSFILSFSRSSLIFCRLAMFSLRSSS